MIADFPRAAVSGLFLFTLLGSLLTRRVITTDSPGAAYPE